MNDGFGDIRFSTAMIADLLDNPHEVFGTDLVFLLSSECGVDWHPPGRRHYVIHDMSPLTHDMRYPTRILTKDRGQDYSVKFDQLLHQEADEKLADFVKYVGYVLSSLVDKELSSAHLFLHIVYVARLSIVFHQRGITDAPALASVLISQTMSELDEMTDGCIYEIFSVFVANVTEEHS